MTQRCTFFDTERGCGLGVVQGIPTESDCSGCREYAGPPRGLGDKVHKVATKFRIPSVVKAVVGSDCGCQERRQALNERFPSKD